MPLRRSIRFLREFGFDVPKFVGALRGIPRFIDSYFKWSIMNKKVQLNIAPALQDFYDQSGSARGHYFWQDLICAQWIYSERPQTHLDLGSRIDGFIAHLLTFMSVEVLDIRPLGTNIPGLSTKVINAQVGLSDFAREYQSVSSLHSIEHFGLGRYRDPLDTDGHIKGLVALSGCVAPGGYLYVSFPIGAPRVEFNSQRILDPEWPMSVLSDFELLEFVLIPWSEEPRFGINPSDVNILISGQCGLYRFIRNSD